MDADLDTLVIALYVKTDELLQRAPQLAPWRPAVGIAPKLTDAELVTLAVLQALLATRAGQTLITDKNYYGVRFEAELAAQGVRLLRPARQGEPDRAGARLFRPLRQVIESVNQTFKGQLDLERHGGHTPAGVLVRVLQRVLALSAAIWHNDHAGQPVARSLVAYDH